MTATKTDGEMTDAKRAALNDAINHVGDPWMHAIDGDAEAFERILAERGFVVRVSVEQDGV